MLREPGKQALSDARGMQKHPAAHPRIYLEESWRLHFFDVDRFALIQYREMHGEVNSLNEGPHERQSHIGYIQIRLHVSAEAENFQAQPVPPGFRLAPQVAPFFEGPQDVTGGAFGYPQLAADLRVREALAALRGGLQNIQGPLHRGRRTGFRSCHGRSP